VSHVHSFLQIVGESGSYNIISFEADFMFGEKPSKLTKNLNDFDIPSTSLGVTVKQKELNCKRY
jgi:hypothetical protein